jgi:DNA-directed RNA polymerase sigma subunit (sigma70/sigma32)
MNRQLPSVTLNGFGEGELADLEDRTGLILRLRSGMCDGERYSMSDVGKKIGLGQERIRQLERRGLLVIPKSAKRSATFGGSPPLPPTDGGFPK